MIRKTLLIPVRELSQVCQFFLRVYYTVLNQNNSSASESHVCERETETSQRGGGEREREREGGRERESRMCVCVGGVARGRGSVGRYCPPSRMCLS